MRRLRRWYIPAYRGQRGPAGRASPQAGAVLTVLTTCLPRVCFIATAVRRSHSSCYYYGKSVCLSHAAIVSKRMHIPSNSFHRLVGHDSSFFEVYRHYKIPKGTPSAGALNTRGGEKLRFSTEIAVYLLETVEIGPWLLRISH